MTIKRKIYSVVKFILFIPLNPFLLVLRGPDFWGYRAFPVWLAYLIFCVYVLLAYVLFKRKPSGSFFNFIDKIVSTRTFVLFLICLAAVLLGGELYDIARGKYVILCDYRILEGVPFVPSCPEDHMLTAARIFNSFTFMLLMFVPSISFARDGYVLLKR